MFTKALKGPKGRDRGAVRGLDRGPANGLEYGSDKVADTGACSEAGRGAVSSAGGLGVAPVTGQAGKLSATPVKAGPTSPYRSAYALAMASKGQSAPRPAESRAPVKHEYEKRYKKETRILFHMCCGPCSIYPIKELLKDTAEVWGFFYNPNIHPLSEFKKRLGAVKTLAGLMSINLICDDAYKPVYFIKNLKASLPPGHAAEKIPPAGKRCTYCYASRLEETAKAALEHGFNAFSSSLLYSKYQNHEEITALGKEIGERLGVAFYYEDFRDGWRDGMEYSRQMGLYRQKYCGCIYSRIERFSKKGKA